MNASGRRCRQFANGFAHISGRRRPRYKKSSISIAESIARGHRTAARQAAMSRKKKTKG